MNGQTWTAAQDEMLLKLWPTYSASTIGAKLGKTRNAVIGRVHRLNRVTFPHEIRKRQHRAETIAKNRKRQEKAVAILNAAMWRGTPRNEAIKLARRHGAYLRVIGQALGISGERVRKILAE